MINESHVGPARFKLWSLDMVDYLEQKTMAVAGIRKNISITALVVCQVL